ncbi:MAG: integrase [Archaeoglobaceae archaeon]
MQSGLSNRNAGGGIRTRGPLRDRALSPADVKEEIEKKEAESTEIAIETESSIDYNTLRPEFYKWLKENVPSMCNQFISTTDKLFSGKKYRNYSELSKELPNLVKGLKRHGINAVRDFAKWLMLTGKITRSQFMDLSPILKIPSSRARTEMEKYLEEEAIHEGFKAIIGDRKNVKELRKVFFKLLLFTGLRESEIRELIKQFDKEILEKTYKVYKIEDLKEKIAVYDMKNVKIPTRKEDKEKRAYVALFPIELVDEILKVKDYPITRKTFQPDRMFSAEFYKRTDLNLRDRNGKFIFLTKLRKFVYNYLMDNANKVADRLQKETGIKPADLDDIVEFIQGRTPEDVGGRHYRDNLRTASRLYYYLVDDLKEKFRDVLSG